ncbi:MAG: DUF4062 domain-containing protein, partial [Candidatus Thorarchaeota archaeon]
MASLLKVFVSSTFRDMERMRKKILSRIDQTLESVGMEKFIPKGEDSQTAAIDELRTSDVVLFLLSPRYGSDIRECSIEDCLADCEMKTGSGHISYTWCEFRFTKTLGTPNLCYQIKSGCWDIVSRDGAPKLWNMANEIRKDDFCPAVGRREKDIDEILAGLTISILNWYEDGTLAFNDIAGRREELKELVELARNHRSVEINGGAGVGKTTLVQMALLFLKLMSWPVIYIGRSGSRSAGSGCDLISLKSESAIVDDITLDSILLALNMSESVLKESDEKKIDMITDFLSKENAVLFLDDVDSSPSLMQLIREAVKMERGCIIFTPIEQMGIGQRCREIELIDEKEQLVAVIAERLGKSIPLDIKKQVIEVIDGHPVIAYLILGALDLLDKKILNDFQEFISASVDKGRANVVEKLIRKLIPGEVQVLKILASIEEEINYDIFIQAIQDKTDSDVDAIISKLIRMFYLVRDGSFLKWRCPQVKSALIGIEIESSRVAAEYHKLSNKIDPDVVHEIEELKHLIIADGGSVHFPSFLALAKRIEKLKGVSYDIHRRLGRLSEWVASQLADNEKALAFYYSGLAYLNASISLNRTANATSAINSFERALQISSKLTEHEKGMLHYNSGQAYYYLATAKEVATNCEKAQSEYEKASSQFVKTGNNEMVARMRNNIGNSYLLLATVKNRPKNVEHALSAFEDAASEYDEGSVEKASIMNNMGIAYRMLAEIQERSKNSALAIESAESAIKVFKREGSTVELAKAFNNLGIAYQMQGKTKASNKERILNFNRALEYLELALKLRDRESRPSGYARTKELTGDTYRLLSTVSERKKNANMAIQHLTEVQDIHLRHFNPIDLSRVRRELAQAYIERSKEGNP